jgi:hypothetical protein
MYTPYEKLYDNLLPKFRSYEIPFMTVEQVKDYLHDYLIPAISRFHVCRKDLSDRDDIVQRFNVKLSDTEIEILSNYLLIEYIDSEYIRVPSLLKVQMPSSDFKVFSPGNFLDKLLEMHKTYVSENETLLSRYAWMGAKESGVRLGAGYKKSKF